jgi:hypothetical protein
MIAVIILLVSCRKNNTLFNELPPSRTGIYFNNKITESDTLNPMDETNIYNGGGIGVGDFNNDGLQDLYFAGNQVSNKLYLNKGDFKFRDVTAEAGVDGGGRWSKGISVVDINNDGWMDIYVSVTMDKNPERRRNLLYVNQGVNKDGIPVFKELAKEYGLDDTTSSTLGAFFDYDNDGDLDMYLCVNEIVPSVNPSVLRPKVTDGSFPSTGRLYRNDYDSILKHPVFTDVSKQAGVTTEGYGHAVTIADFNLDGWKDIFVSNDFTPTDLLYINNHDGTFTDKSASYFKHTSANGMGQDVIDINNDGLADVIELDMNPHNNYRKKMMLGNNNYLTYLNSDLYGYQYQYVRNTLQLNQGPIVNKSDSVGDPIFSDIGYMAGISQTDWSWCPLVTDFDNDGFRDIIITNGFPRDITDHDFVGFRMGSSQIASTQYTMSQIPQVKLRNFAFRNNGDWTFSNLTNQWGIVTPTFANGAVYVDLDNDGDMDVVVNNINDEASVYQNTIMNSSKNPPHFLSVKLYGNSKNVNGLGTFIELHYKGKKQVYEQTPYRGYLSTMQIEPHFGLGDVSLIDSLIVKWPNGKAQILKNVKANQMVAAREKDANIPYSLETTKLDTEATFKDVTNFLNVRFTQLYKDFNDFAVQGLLPHKFSEYGPALAVGDVDGNGLDDILVGGAFGFSAQIFLQQPDGNFIQRDLLRENDISSKEREDEGLLLFDADGDGDLDLYVASGGFQAKSMTAAYQDRLYVNDGKGKFTEDSSALPPNFTSKFCVKASDYDRDGDLDLFVSGRVDVGNYPKPVSSFIFRNDSKAGHVRFTDVTSVTAPALQNIGMVSDALFTDFNNDGWPDLVLVGEWMPVTFLENQNGVFKNVTISSGINNHIGWWSSIAAGDFDNDGDMDYIAGNLGRNSFFQASDKYPVKILAKDFDNNGSLDAIMSLFLPTSASDTTRREFPAESRDDIFRQLPALRKRYPNYKSFANSTIDSIFPLQDREGAIELKANYFSSAVIKNEGKSRFTINALPKEAQISVLNGMVVNDFDEDGNLDVLVNGNDFGTEPILGRYDALNGILLRGDGKGNFIPLSILQSGVFIGGNGKALVQFRNKSNKLLIAASQNKGPLKIFELNKDIKMIPLNPMDESVTIYFKDGRKQKREVGYGSSFLSQSGRFITVGDNVKSVQIINNKGQKRSVDS